MGCTVPLEEEEEEQGRAAKVKVVVPVSPVMKPVVPAARLPVVPSPLLTAASKAAQKEFTFGYWQHGWRKLADARSPNIFCLETGRYGFTLDVADFRKTKFF